MLDLSRPIELPEMPEVRVYADTADATVFYAVPARPRLAVGPGGEPELELTLLGRKGRQGFEVTGALVSLTTALDLPQAVLARVAAVLGRRTGGGTPRIAPATWTGGRVEVTLAPGVTLEGRPALYGDNRCALQGRFGAEEARRLETAWQDGLPEAEAVYRLRTAPTPSTVRREWRQETHTHRTGGDTATFEAAAAASAQRPAGDPGELSLAGPLGPGPGAGAGRVTRLEM